MKPWFIREGDIIQFPKKDDKIIQLPSVDHYPSFIDGARDLHAKLKAGEISSTTHSKLYTNLIHKWSKKENMNPWFMSEDTTNPEIKQLKSFVEKAVEGAGLKITASSRHGTHTRFAFPGELKDYQKFFQPMGIKVTERPSISGQFETYNLTTQKAIGNIPIGTQLPWVNNYTGKGSRAGKTFGDKDLTPKSVGLAGVRINAGDIFSKIKSGIKHNQDYAPYGNQLLELAKRSTSSGSSISLSGVDLNEFSISDLATVSKNYGEVLASLWCTTNLNYEKILFPNIDNAKMIDFYGELDGVDYPVSVKSGEIGGKVSILNILDALEDKVKAGKVNLAEQKSYKVFEIVRDHGMKQQMLELHKYFKTEPIQKLANMIGTSVENLNAKTLMEWLKKFTNNQQFKKQVLPWHQDIGKGIKSITWDNPDRLMAIIGPLGQWILDYLNQDEEIKGSLTQLAQQLSIIQVNVDVKKSLMTFYYNRFEDAEFYFNWAGYLGGNKLGFNMNLKPKIQK